MICPFCHRDVKRLESHHAPGVANSPTFRVPACERCHAELNVRLSDAGVLLKHDAARDDADRAWALMHGAAELVVAAADDADPAALAVQRVTLAAGRTIAASVKQPFGPDPITASRRDERRLRERDPRPTLAEPTASSWAVSLSERMSAAAGAWEAELGEQFPLPEGEAGYASLLNRLDRYPRVSELLEIPREMIGRIGGAVLDPLSADALEELEAQRVRLLGLYCDVADAGSDEEAFALADAALEELGS